MTTPYIKPSQPNIDPSVVQDILDFAWDKFNNAEKEIITHTLNRHDVIYEI